MNKQSYWSEFYSVSLEKIPWQRTQMDWLVELIESGKVKGKIALDLGCGTGIKSIYLAKNGFKHVVGIDIAPRAIKYAKGNAAAEKVGNKVQFVNHDVTDLAFLEESTFDLILDWACLHCLHMGERKTYVKQIAQHVIPTKSQLVLRTFSNEGGNKKYFMAIRNNRRARIYLLSDSEVLDLYNPYFKIIARHKSSPRNKKELVFHEYLMQAR